MAHDIHLMEVNILRGGDLMPKDDYSCHTSSIGDDTNLKILPDSLDVAQMRWKKGWRMPTMDEMSELKNKCKFELKVYLGTFGFKVTGPNNNSIFFSSCRRHL